MKLLTLALVGICVAGISAQAPAPQGGRGAAAQGRGAAAGSGRAAPAPPPPAPAAGSPGNYKVDADLMAVLKRSIETNGDNMATSNIANTDQYSINIVRRAKGAGAIAHQGWTEVHHIIDGSATFVTGGTIVRPPAGSPAGTVATIEGGVSKHIGKGDVVVIPENSPHWYKDVDGSVTYLEVRFIAPKK
jgi:mannose-6-phosphate isomerase-like protein (cupin superfamily)